MRRDSQKSDVYLRENSPQGAGYEWSRIPRSSSPSVMELPLHTRRAWGDDGATYIGGGEEERAMACRGGSDLQLLHISREAKKLNQMIGSWSKSPSFDGRSRDIAADLLKGALDLQESLLMLRRLQEAPSLMAQTMTPQSYSFKEEEEVCREMDLRGSTRFDGSSYQGTPQAPRVPVDRSSSRNRLEELKKVIKDSLHRQNLLSVSISDDEKSSSGRYLNLPPSNRFGEHGHKREGSGPAAAEQKKAKAPSLIARLMGLEDTPAEKSQPVRSNAERKSQPVRSNAERRGNTNQPRQFFDVEMAKVSKQPSPEEKPEPGRKTLQEIIEAMQSKGLLRAVGREDTHARAPVEQYIRQVPTDGEAPPIVIIKPLNLASLKVEESQKFLVGANRASAQEKVEVSDMTEEVAAGMGTVAPKEIGHRAEPAGEDKVGEPSGQPKTTASHLKLLKKETNTLHKKPDAMQKPVPGRGRSENRGVRLVAASVPQTKTASSTPRKPERRPALNRNHASKRTSSSVHETRSSTKPAPRKSTDTAKGRRTTKPRGPRPDGEPTIDMQADSQDSIEEDKEIIPSQEKSISSVSLTLPSNLPPNETEHRSITSKRDSGKESSFHCEVMPKRGHGGVSSPPLAHAPKQPAEKENLITVPAESADHLNRLLLSSPSFLLLAQELFMLAHHQPSNRHRTETEQIHTGDSVLLLDCSTELMKSRSHRSELLNHHPLFCLSSSKGPEAVVSVNQLVEEISQEIKNLRNYSNGGDTVASRDGLYGRLERDLKCNRAFGCGVWDYGWMEGIPVEEADRVVCDVEKHVLNVLVEDIVVDFAH